MPHIPNLVNKCHIIICQISRIQVYSYICLIQPSFVTIKSAFPYINQMNLVNFTNDIIRIKGYSSGR